MVRNQRQGHQQAQRRVLLVWLAIAILASATQCSSVSPPTTSEPAPTHLGLAYYSERDGIKNQGALYLLDLESGEEQRLTSKDEVITLDSGFSWSPGARKFAYAAGLDRETEIYTVDHTGQQRQRLTNNTWQDTAAVWSPDGSQIAFLRRGGELDDTLMRPYVMNAEGGEQKRLLDDPDMLTGGISWAPNGQQVALGIWNYQSSTNAYPINDILVLDLNNNKQVLHIADGSNHSAKRWSHDGTKLAYTSNQGGVYQLYVVDVTTGKQTKLSEIGNVLAFDWAPDDAHVAFSASPDQVFDIYVIRSDGTGLVNVTDRPAYDVGCSWSPDGQRIAFVSTVLEQEASFEIYTLEVNTGVIDQITHNEFLDGPPRWITW